MHKVVTGVSCQSPIEPNTLHFVSDDELLFRTRELARHETELTIVTIQHLDEIERRGLYDKRGYPSLFEYAVRELHYSKGCTWRRIMVMKLCRAVPGIADKLRSGELNLTTASQLQNAIEKRARKAARNAARERASESVSVPAAGAASAGAGESVSGEVHPAQAGVAGVAAAASGVVWAPVGAAATPVAAGESAAGGESVAGKSAAAAPGAGWVPVGAAATQVAAGESAAGQSAAGESPARESAAGGESAAGKSAAAAVGAVWAPGGAAATQAVARESAAGESAAAVPVPAGSVGTAPAATGVAAAAMLSPAQAGTAGAAPAAAVPAAPGKSPHATAAARAAGKAAVAARAALAPAAASPVPGAARESAALLPVAEPPPAWTLDQQVELVDLVANKSARETERLLAELEPEVGLPRERQRALGGGRYELRVILDQGSVDTIAKLKGWLSHVNPGFTTGHLLAHLLQQAERKYDPMRERGRSKRAAAAPARHAETCEQQLGVTNERQAAGSALGAAVSKADSSTCATGASGAGEGVRATGSARGSVAAGSVAAAPAPGPAAAGSVDAGFPGAAPAAAGPSVALAGGSVQNRKAQPVAAPGSAQDRRDTPGSAQNQQPPLVPDRSGDRIPRHAPGWVDAGSPAPAPAAASPQRRTCRRFGAEPESAAGSGPGQRAGSARHARFGAEPAAAAGSKRWFSYRHRAARQGVCAAARAWHGSAAVSTRIPTRAPRAAAYPGGGTARGVAEVRWGLLLPGPAHRRDLWLQPPGTDRPHRAGGAGR